MAIDWSNEPFARLYKRETDDDLLLSWEARAVWHEFLKKCDPSGILATRRGVQGMAALLRIPLEVVERVLQELLEDGRIRSSPGIGIVAPNYIDANYAPRSDKARQIESRIRRKQDALSGGKDQTETGTPSHDVTTGHTASQPVTHIISDHIISDHQHAPEALLTPPPAKPKKQRTKVPQHPLPPDWQPRDQERDLAREYGLDCDHEAAEFITYWLGEGRGKANWDQTFANRLHSQAKRRPNWQRQSSPSQPRRIEEL